jgi:hypothetical protein
MQGAVYCWVKNRMDERFAVHDLMGGENALWHGTPLIVLYQKHVDNGKDEAAAMSRQHEILGVS